MSEFSGKKCLLKVNLNYKEYYNLLCYNALYYHSIDWICLQGQDRWASTFTSNYLVVNKRKLQVGKYYFSLNDRITEIFLWIKGSILLIFPLESESWTQFLSRQKVLGNILWGLQNGAIQWTTLGWAFLPSVFYIYDCIGIVRKPEFQKLWLVLSLLVKKCSILIEVLMQTSITFQKWKYTPENSQYALQILKENLGK